MKPMLEFSIGAYRDTHLKICVKVWRHYDQLQRARKRVGDKGVDHVPCDGFCHRFHNRHCDELSIGEIHLCRTNLSIETIAHEAVHAAVGYMEWVRPADKRATIDSRDMVARNDAIDEGIAYSTGFITEGIVWNLRREKCKIKPL